tara:strand:+ start:3871 stop:4776 length:906 start_codon:yes stop_codon:yes gene_type:complete
MLLQKIKYLLLACMLSCTAEYSVRTGEVIEIGEAAGEIHVDSFIQPSRPEQIDVLVLLDTSCSMSDNYNQVSTGIELLRTDLNSVTNDYNIAFINTSLIDPYFAGIFDNQTPIIDFIIAPWSLGGDFTEAGFSALYEFTNTTPEAIQFFRETADKLFIFISDEEEQSNIPVGVFEDWLKDEFRGVQRDVVSIVTLPDSACEYTSYSANIGQRYIDLARLYGKDGIDICSDWELWLSDSTFLRGPRDYINLSYTPIEDSIKMYVDRIETTAWDYDESTNTVFFHRTPPEGALVEAVYLKELE